MEIFKKVNKCLLHNAAFKASAFFLALLAWFYFFSEREGISFRLGAASSVSVRVMVLEQPRSLHSAEVIPGTVELSLRGARDVIGNIGPEDFKVFVETRGLPAGIYSLPVRVFTDRQAAVVSRQPSHVTVYVKERWTKVEELP